MSPWEFWLEYDTKKEQARTMETRKLGGKFVSQALMEEAFARASKQHKAKLAKLAEKAKQSEGVS